MTDPGFRRSMTVAVHNMHYVSPSYTEGPGVVRIGNKLIRLLSGLGHDMYVMPGSHSLRGRAAFITQLPRLKHIDMLIVLVYSFPDKDEYDALYDSLWNWEIDDVVFIFHNRYCNLGKAVDSCDIHPSGHPSCVFNSTKISMCLAGVESADIDEYCEEECEDDE